MGVDGAEFGCIHTGHKRLVRPHVVPPTLVPPMLVPYSSHTGIEAVVHAGYALEAAFCLTISAPISLPFALKPPKIAGTEVREHAHNGWLVPGFRFINLAESSLLHQHAP